MDLEKIYNNDRPNARIESLLAGAVIELRKLNAAIEESLAKLKENVHVQKIEPEPIEVKEEPKKATPKKKPVKKKTTTSKKGK